MGKHNLQFEIEKSWWVKDINKKLWNIMKRLATKFEVTQYYIKPSQPGNPLIRYRKMNEKYYITIKKQAGKKRIEDEREISKDEYENNKKNIIGNIIEKTRYKIKDSQTLLTFEFDEYKLPKDYKGIIRLEIEFKSVKDMESFKLEENKLLCKIADSYETTSIGNQDIANVNR